MPFQILSSLCFLPSLQLLSITLKPSDLTFCSRSAEPTVTLLVTIKLRNLFENISENQGKVWS